MSHKKTSTICQQNQNDQKIYMNFNKVLEKVKALNEYFERVKKLSLSI